MKVRRQDLNFDRGHVSKYTMIMQILFITRNDTEAVELVPDSLEPAADEETAWLWDELGLGDRRL